MTAPANWFKAKDSIQLVNNIKDDNIINLIYNICVKVNSNLTEKQKA